MEVLGRIAQNVTPRELSILRLWLSTPPHHPPSPWRFTILSCWGAIPLFRKRARIFWNYHPTSTVQPYTFCKQDCLISGFISSILITKNNNVKQLSLLSYDNIISSRHLSLFDSSGLCTRSHEGVPLMKAVHLIAQHRKSTEESRVGYRVIFLQLLVALSLQSTARRRKNRATLINGYVHFFFSKNGWNTHSESVR